MPYIKIEQVMKNFIFLALTIIGMVLIIAGVLVINLMSKMNVH